MQRKHFAWVVVVSLLVPCAVGAEPDEEGSKDHPMFSRMPGFHIEQYAATDFDSATFDSCAEEDDFTVEGRTTRITYRLNEGGKMPSSLQLVRNYENAGKKIGFGKVCENDDPGNRFMTMKLARDGREVWVRVYPGDTYYELVVVEKGELRQDVTASWMLEALEKEGRVALYINFDTGKATLRPDAKPVVEEIAKLLSQNPALKLSVEGHTDTVGGAKANKKLSEDRARAVVAALVEQGIDAKRLISKGFGQEKPVASNDTDDGRAKNRRVELVKQ